MDDAEVSDELLQLKRLKMKAAVGPLALNIQGDADDQANLGTKQNKKKSQMEEGASEKTP